MCLPCAAGKKEIAQQHGTSVNRPIDEMATGMLAEFDAETHFLLRAERGRRKIERGLVLLEKVSSQAD